MGGGVLRFRERGRTVEDGLETMLQFVFMI